MKTIACAHLLRGVRDCSPTNCQPSLIVLHPMKHHICLLIDTVCIVWIRFAC